VTSSLLTHSQVLAETGPILLDFDGPVCAVFAGLPSPVVASRLRQLLANEGLDAGPVAAEDDPLQVLRYIDTFDREDLTRRADDRLRDEELTAVASARPTLHLREMLVAASNARRPVIIVSNNSAPAIARYLGAQGLAGLVRLVVGRAYGQPRRMKPNPAPIVEAVNAIGADASACVLIGDSVTDMIGAKAAGVRSLGYANRSDKRGLLIGAGADAIVEGKDAMREIALALRA
jgi:HAD superfamily hydrolase (TIGR01549 family)